MRSTNSFTLIELLIVIGILAILVAAVVVVLNPTQLLAQARDSKRQQDLSALTHALNTITALDQTTFFGTSSMVYTSLPDSSSTCASWSLPTLPSGWSYHCVATSSLQNTDGTGWIPVNFKTNGVINLSALPTDPQNTSSTGLYYTYVTGGSFQLAAHFESTKYQATQGSDAMYAVGSNLTLAPFLSGLVGWWPLNEGTGTTVYDQSGYNNNGTWNGTSTTHYVVNNGRMMGYFNGVSDNASSSKSILLGSAWTMSVWVVTGAAGEVPLMSSRGYGGSVYFGMVGGHGFIYQNECAATNPSDVTNAGINNGVPHLFVFVRNSASAGTMYVDGSLDKMPMPTNACGVQSGGLRIGWDHDNVGEYFSGTLRDARIYNRALSATEIGALYNATK